MAARTSLAPAIRRAIRRLAAGLDPKHRRRFAGLWAAYLGRGGVSVMAAVTRLSRRTVARGLREVLTGHDAARARVRTSGGGRPRAEKKIRASRPRSPR